VICLHPNWRIRDSASDLRSRRALAGRSLTASGVAFQVILPESRFFAAAFGQLVALRALVWWTGRGLAHWADFARDRVAVTLIICISTPVQVLLLALLARQTRASAADYLGLTLPRIRDVVRGLIAVFVFIIVGDGRGNR
jgi:hypothetical protein